MFDLTSLRGFCRLTGANMEMLGRRALWEVGLNYGHGTGHGVGNYFGVHECMFSFYFQCVFQSLQPQYETDHRLHLPLKPAVASNSVHLLK